MKSDYRHEHFACEWASERESSSRKRDERKLFCGWKWARAWSRMRWFEIWIRAMKILSHRLLAFSARVVIAAVDYESSSAAKYLRNVWINAFCMFTVKRQKNFISAFLHSEVAFFPSLQFHKCKSHDEKFKIQMCATQFHDSNNFLLHPPRGLILRLLCLLPSVSRHRHVAMVTAFSECQMIMCMN